MMRRFLLVLYALVLGVSPVPLLAAETTESAGEDATHWFTDRVLPILQKHCFECHAGEEYSGGFQLDTRSRLIAGGDSGAVVDMQDAEASLLLEAVRYESYEMPPRGKLPDEQIAILEKWVAAGAPYPDSMIGEVEAQRPADPGAEITAADRRFWSFQPLSDPVPPTPIDPAWCANPIDAFIAQRREDADLPANPDASPAALIRRLHYDLTGLPPSLELVEAFTADPSPQHYRQIVDSLLASPQYGERWGRHWLDLVRYAETNSYERDGAKPEVWRYRDYVIESFNEGKPFDQFAQEQIAGDEMEYWPERLIATGYYRLGIWDDEPVDRKQALYDDLDDIVSTTSRVFLGLTVDCARCHDHKIDPIGQADYYQMLAFFSGLNRFGVRGFDSIEQNSLRPLVPPAESREYLAAVDAYRKEIGNLNRKIDAFEKKLKPDLVAVEKEEFRHEMNRVPLARMRAGELFTADEVDRYEAWLTRRRKVEREKPQELARALCVTEVGSEARQAYVLTRGSPHAEAEPVEPAFPEVLGGGPARYEPARGGETSGRRTALAEWIADPQEQPLTARVTANRLWQYHFGRGLVRTPNDFGFQGSPPTHPELLDFLASRLVEHGWHLKPLHRLMVLSRTYRMSALARDDALAVDPANDFFWRFNPRRLSAEVIRDSMLAVAGKLNLERGGPSMYPLIPDEVLAGQSRPGSGWEKSSPAERAQRSIYIHIKRSLRVPLLASFDAADTDNTCPVRFATTQPTQALGLLNGQFVRRVADAMAADVRRAAGEAVPALVTESLRRIAQREPTAEEVAQGVALMERLMTEHGEDRETALQLFCLLSLNLNEFVFVD
jgi:mono/diheme cytochrome c family protein